VLVCFSFTLLWVHVCTRLLYQYIAYIVRPPDILVGGLRFFRVSVFFFYLIGFIYCPRCSLNRTQPKLATCSEVSTIPSPYKSRAQKPRFLTISRLNGNFNSLHLLNETRYRQSAQPGKCVDNYTGSPTLSQNVMNFGPQMA